MTRFRQFLGLLGLAFALAVAADEPGRVDAQRYVADIELQSESDLDELLGRAEQLLVEGKLGQGGAATVILVVHGPVLRALMKPNYSASKALVDKAASLTALGVIEIKACQSWLGENGLSEAQLQPFVGLVPFGPSETRRLVKEQDYIFF